MIDPTELKPFLSLYPTPWTQDADGTLCDANGQRVWDVADANDNADLAGAIMRLVNQIGPCNCGAPEGWCCGAPTCIRTDRAEQRIREAAER